MQVFPVYSAITSAALFIELLVGLALVWFGLALYRRRRDPGLMLVIAWGGLWVLSGLLNVLTQLVVRSLSLPLVQLAFTVSVLPVIGGRLLVWAVAAYVLWWYWNAVSGRGRSG